MSERFYVKRHRYWDDGPRTGYDVKDRENPDAELGGSEDDDWAYAEVARLNAEGSCGNRARTKERKVPETAPNADQLPAKDAKFP